MSIRNKIIATIIGLSLVAMMVPSGVAQAALTESQIQAILTLLTSFGADATTVANVESSLRGTTPVIPATPGTYTGIPAGFTFTKNLPVGTVDQDVVYLKAVLIGEGCGDGITNTTYYGPKTKANVQCFQNKYKAEISAFAGYTIAASGFVGTGTRAQLNVLIAVPGGAVCGNAVCETGETNATCPADCPISGTGLNVALASDNPASGTIVSGSTATDAQGGADLAHFTFVNGDNAEVKVTTLSLKRIGVSDDALLNNVYLYDGANRLTDGASVSSGIINFNDATGLFTVPAGGSKTIRVLVDTVYNKSGQTVGVSVVSATSVTTNASSVKGTFPVSSNLMTTASATLATVNFAYTTSPSTASVDPENDYTVWQNITSIGTRAVTIKRFALRQTGSALAVDVQNYRLYIDGVQVGSAVASADANGYVTFDLSASPVRIETGTRTIKVLADIIGGSSKNFIYSLRASTDAAFTDTQVGVDLVPTYTNVSGTSGTAFAQRITGTMSINSGTATFTKTTDSPSGNIVLSAANATLAKYTIKAAGEPVKISDLYVGIVDSTTSTVVNFRNGALYANGVQIGSTTNITEGDITTGTHFSLGSSLIVNPGSPVTLEIRADIYESSTNHIADKDSIYAAIIAGSSNAEGRVSKTTISTPAAITKGNTLTVKTGTLTLSKYTAYTNQAMVPPLTNAKLAHFTLTAATSEAVSITSIEANLNSTVSTYATNLYVKFGDQTTTVKPAISAASNPWSVNYTLAAGQTKDLIVYADISSAAGGTGYVSVYVGGTTGSSATSATAGTTGVYTAGTTGVQGQAIAFTTGTFTPAVDGATPMAQIVAGGQLVTAGKFKFSTQYDSYTINELRFTVANNSNTANNSSAIVSAVVKDGDTVLATVPYDSTNDFFNITGLSVPVTANTNKVLTLAYNLSPAISSSSTNSQVDVEPTLAYVKYSNSQGTPTCVGTKLSSETTCTATTTYATSKVIYAYKTIPTVAKVPLTTSILYAGDTKDLYSWSVAAAPQGDIAVKQFTFGTSWTQASGHTLYLYAFKLYKNNSDITSLVSISDEDGHNLKATTSTAGANSSSANIFVNFLTEDTIGVGTTATYILRATAAGFVPLADAPNSDAVSINMPADTTDIMATAVTYKYIKDNNTVSYICDSAGANPQPSNAATATTSIAGTAGFIWSDMSAIDHEYGAATTGLSTSGDWSNGYLVQSLPLSTTTWVGP